MAGQAKKPKKSKKQLERESLQLSLTERRVRLGLTVVVSLSGVVGLWLSHWTVAVGSALAAGASALGGRLR